MKISKNFIFLVQALMILISTKTSSALVSPKNRHASELLDKIFFNNSQSAMNYGGGQKNMARFLNKIVPNIGNAESVCSSKVLQSNFQSKMRMLRSIISSCPGYCRLAMSQNGILYGSKNEFSLETIWRRIDAKEASLTAFNLGAFYIKFIQSDKFLCINKDGYLFALTFENNECLWLNAISQLKSAKYLHLNVVINKNCNVNIKSTARISVYSNSYEASQIEDQQNESCQSNTNVTSGFSPDLQNFFRTCQARIRQQQQTTIIKHPLYSINNSPDKLNLKNEISPIQNQNELAQQEQEVTTNQKFRKCYKYRRTSNYRKCMKMHYKCFQFNKDVEKLKKCRKKFDIKPIPLYQNKQLQPFKS